MNPIATLIAAHIDRWRIAGEPLIIGLCGTQASGKTTACAQVAAYFAEQDLRVGVMSLDDLYLSRTARRALAATVHPLFATRGPPGTHDVALGIDVLDKVRRGEAVHLARFSKALDEPLPESEWPQLAAGCDVFLFEGWCVGARPQDAVALAEPVNALEREEDADSIWRRYFTAHLAGPTGDLFSRIDRLIYLHPPSFDVVYQWRCQQEHELIAKAGPAGAPAAMNDVQIARFIAHYERMTNHIITEMPSRADLVIQLGEGREVLSVIANDH
jgi:D-glycerate 3-kinase